MDSTKGRRHSALRWAKRFAIALVLLSVTAYAAISLVSAEVLTRPSNHASRLNPRDVCPDATAWATRTSDGLVLRGWYLPTPERRRLIVLVHGMASSWDEMAALGRDLHHAGYDTLLFDLRGHGQSDSSRLYMGRRERRDVRAVLEWACRMGYDPDRIGWLGYSMGGSMLLMEAADNPNIRCAVVDSAFGDLPHLLNTQLTKYSHLPSWFNPGILLAARWAFGVRTDDLVPIRSARKWGARPLLLIHGEADSIVPVAHAAALACAAGPECQAVTMPGVEHVEAFSSSPKRYVALVDQFFDKNLKR
jgi:uncharacterized protein